MTHCKRALSVIHIVAAHKVLRTVILLIAATLAVPLYGQYSCTIFANDTSQDVGPPVGPPGHQVPAVWGFLLTNKVITVQVKSNNRVIATYQVKRSSPNSKYLCDTRTHSESLWRNL